jgi:hypothetical protein
MYVFFRIWRPFCWFYDIYRKILSSRREWRRRLEEMDLEYGFDKED